jgi:hypothetical protein
MQRTLLWLIAQLTATAVSKATDPLQLFVVDLNQTQGLAVRAQHQSPGL